MSTSKQNTEQLKWYEKKSRRRFSENGTDITAEVIAAKHPKKSRSTTKEVEATAIHKPQSSRAPYSNQIHPSATLLLQGSLFSSAVVPRDAQNIIASFDKIISSSQPLSSKQRVLLPQQIRELSHNLTDERSDRRLGYMNQTTTLSAYIYYYEWWNLVRLTKLFANLPEAALQLDDNAICLDVGSGPLTVPIALLLARPQLRNKKLTWYCMDLSSTALAAGEEILLAVSAKLQCEPWKIIRVKGELGTPIKEKVSLVTCANVFNEIVDDFSMPPDYLAKKYCEKILSYTDHKSAQVLIVEPGVPKSARFISLLRDAFMIRNFAPQAPCTHCNACPMDGKRGGKWCNFAFATDDAPSALKKLSEQANLPKERAVLSFICVKENENVQAEQDSAADKPNAMISFRVTSDPIRLPGNRTGYYACSEDGLLLVVTHKRLASGEWYKIKRPASLDHVDAKSGAFVIDA